MEISQLRFLLNFERSTSILQTFSRLRPLKSVSFLHHCRRSLPCRSLGIYGASASGNLYFVAEPATASELWEMHLCWNLENPAGNRNFKIIYGFFKNLLTILLRRKVKESSQNSLFKKIRAEGAKIFGTWKIPGTWKILKKTLCKTLCCVRDRRRIVRRKWSRKE